jgi:small subunit ribosomal protein S13
MVSLLSVNLSSEKKLGCALTKIYGINLATALFICNRVNLPFNFSVHLLTSDKIREIISLIQNFILCEFNLHKEVKSNIKFLIDIKCYKGFRHSLNLPVNGQRTHSNAKTCRRNKKFI